ncbi:uncharacterized protein LTHEOB_3695 [Neofusicoccum parvum]|nr:uncharacterized protein LTHEOB_3695 [Neofusicoccum parvum]
MLALFAARSIDTTILPSTVLTIVSAVASISYVVVHSIVARRQNRLQHEYAPRRFENACYVALRLAVALCILWLMTSGWNFIIAARQPTCLSESSSNATEDSWKVGSSCAAERFSSAVSFIALVASCTLFGILAIVRRPFEATLLGFSTNTSTQHHYHNPFLHSRKLSHPEDGGIGVYNPALHRPGTSASIVSSLASSSFFRPDTAVTEKNPAGGLTISSLSTPGPSFPSTPSTGDLAATANSAQFSWVPSPRLSPTSRNSSNALGIFNSPSLVPAPLSLLPAAPLPTMSSHPPLLRRPVAGTRRVSSANSILTTSSASSSPGGAGPRPAITPQRRARSYGHLSLMASGALPAPSPVPVSPPRVRVARSPPPLDSAWRAVHPSPPPLPRRGAAADAGLHVPRARPPSMPHSPPQSQVLRRPGEEAAQTTRAQLTAAALASLTAAQGAGLGHRRKGSGPPPPAAVTVRPVVGDAERVTRLASPAVLCLQQRARAQRPLRGRSFEGGSGSGSGSSTSASGSWGGRGGGSPLSTMVRACEVEVEVLRGEMERAGEARRGVLGGGADERVGGLERSGRWCRVRRGLGGAGAAGWKEGGRRGGEAASVEGDIAVEGMNWVRNASGEESVGEGGDPRAREDSGVGLDVTAVPCLRVSVVEKEEVPRRQLLPSWSGGVVAKTSPEQSFLDAVLAAGKVTPVLSAQPGDDVMECLERSETIVVRRARSLEELQGKGGHGDGVGNAGAEVGTRVGLGLSWVIGVGSGVVAQDEVVQGLQREEVKPLDIKRVPRTRRRTVVLG